MRSSVETASSRPPVSSRGSLAYPSASTGSAATPCSSWTRGNDTDPATRQSRRPFRSWMLRISPASDLRTRMSWWAT